MPSVQRPLEQQYIGSSPGAPARERKRPLSAKFNTKGYASPPAHSSSVQSQSVPKRKVQDANASMLAQVGGRGPLIDPISFENTYLAAAAAPDPAAARSM